MISVCMLTFNGEKYLCQQIESILLQLNINDEFLISDDGSTDNTILILIKYFLNDKRIRLFIGPCENNINKNFSFLINYVRGDIIFLADQDDIWLKNKVKFILNFFKKHINVNLIVSDLKVVDKNLKLIYYSYFKFRKVKSGFFFNIFKNCYIGAGIAFRKKFLNKILPIPKLILIHDVWLGLIAEFYKTSKFIYKSLTLYRRHENNYSNINFTFNFFYIIKNRLILIIYLIKRIIFKKK